jgi:hypothetical protein
VCGVGLLLGGSDIEWLGYLGLEFLVVCCLSLRDRRGSNRTMVSLSHRVAGGLVYTVTGGGVLC